MDSWGRSIGKVALQAGFVGVVAGLAYGLMLHLQAPLCPPTATDCAVDTWGVLFAIQLGGVAMALALPVLALRARLGWVVAAVATTVVLALNLAWFLATAADLTVSGMWTVSGRGNP
ncbi:hypothetical protein AB0E63_08695 [Kribbella sp. NPDC026596]|uniref:hypothetical protein n=1 Tax=Kribbella sp. NPDC026596 TaxID=3155122 RepID=UPI0033D8513D